MKFRSTKKLISLIIALTIMVSTALVFTTISNAYIPTSPTTVSGMFINGETNTFDFIGTALKVGFSESYINQVFGTPVYTLDSGYGFTWYVYNNYNKYIQIGIKNGTVVAFYSNYKYLKYYDNSTGILKRARVGSTRPEVRSCMGKDPAATRDYSDTFVVDNTNITFFYTCYEDGDRIVRSMYAIDSSIAGSFGNNSFGVDFSTEEEKEQAMMEISQDFSVLACEIINTHRVANGLAPFTRNDTASNVALAHSKDMGERDYADIKNPDGLTVPVLFNLAGLRYSTISATVPDNPVSDPVYLVESLLDKSWTRLFNKSYTHLGLGGYVLGGTSGHYVDGNCAYYSQKAYNWVFIYYTPRSW